MPFTDNLPAENTDPWYSGIVSAWNNLKTFVNGLETTLGLKANTSDVTTSLGLKANIASPTFTGTVGGITKSMVGLGNVDNTADTAKPVSTAQQTALDLKANLASPTFTGTVGGITKTMVGLGNVDNTADLAKPISTATQTALDAKLTTPVDPNADRILFWDDSAGTVTWLTIGSGLGITGTTLTATGGTAASNSVYYVSGDWYYNDAIVTARPDYDYPLFFIATTDELADPPAWMATYDIWVPAPGGVGS